MRVPVMPRDMAQIWKPDPKGFSDHLVYLGRGHYSGMSVDWIWGFPCGIGSDSTWVRGLESSFHDKTPLHGHP